MSVKLVEGTRDIKSKPGETAHLVAPPGVQVIVDPQGKIGPVGPIKPDPDDPFGPALAASTPEASRTTPGTEQHFLDAPLHNGEQQLHTYSFAGGILVQA